MFSFDQERVTLCHHNSRLCHETHTIRCSGWTQQQRGRTRQDLCRLRCTEPPVPGALLSAVEVDFAPARELLRECVVILKVFRQRSSNRRNDCVCLTRQKKSSACQTRRKKQPPKKLVQLNLALCWRWHSGPRNYSFVDIWSQV